MIARGPADAFAIVESLGLKMPGVVRVTKYDGSPTLQLDGCFLAGLAVHPSAEPDSLVVRTTLEDRELLLAEAPATYYVTAYYEPYPIVLVRLSRIDSDALRDLLSVSWRLTSAKSRAGRSRTRRPGKQGSRGAASEPAGNA